MRIFIGLRQFIGDHLGLPEHGFRGEFLHVGRIAILSERPLDDDLEFRLDVFLDRPVDRGVVFDLPVEDDGEFAELFLAHEFAGAFVVRDRRVEGIFVGAEAQRRTFRVHRPDFLAQADDLLDHLGRGDNLVVIAEDGGFEHLHEAPSLHQVGPHADRYLVPHNLA